MVALLNRWAALEPAWCHIDERRIYFGPPGQQEWIEPSRRTITWRQAGCIQMAVLLALDARAWRWQRGSDGLLTVGHPEGVRAVVRTGDDFSSDLLSAYVQRLEIDRCLLAVT